jgi:hypothetical protein
MYLRKEVDRRQTPKVVEKPLATNELVVTRGRNDTGQLQAVTNSQNVLYQLFLSKCPTDKSACKRYIYL